MAAWAVAKLPAASEQPPLRHAYDIIQNANLFHERWGWWPTQNRLAQLAHRGLARFDPSSSQWHVTETSVAC